MNSQGNQESDAKSGESAGQTNATQASSVGEILAQAREATGLSVEDIARQLRFGVRQIQALEAGRLDQLPGGTFVRGIVRSYARLLKLDPAPLIERLEGKFAAPDANQLATLFRQPVPFSDGAKRSNIVYGVVTLTVLLVAGVLAYQWWFRESTPVPPQAAAPAQTVSEPPVAEIASAPQAAPAVAQPPVKPTPARPAPQAAPAAPQLPVKPASARPAPQTANPAGAPGIASPSLIQSPPSPASTPVARGKRRVEFEFEEESWVEVTNGMGQIVTSHLNLPGSRRVVEGIPPLTVVIGNAQHVKVYYKDKPIDLKPHIKVEVARLVLE